MDKQDQSEKNGTFAKEIEDSGPGTAYPEYLCLVRRRISIFLAASSLR